MNVASFVNGLARRQREKLMPVVRIIFVPADGVEVWESG
jgi:hypothetical protein